MCVSIRALQMESAVRHSIGTSLAVGFVFCLATAGQPADARSLSRDVRGILPGVAAPLSCAGHCGLTEVLVGLDGSKKCTCDHFCERRGDCCEDFFDLCEADEETDPALTPSPARPYAPARTPILVVDVYGKDEEEFDKAADGGSGDKRGISHDMAEPPLDAGKSKSKSKQAKDESSLNGNAPQVSTWWGSSMVVETEPSDSSSSSSSKSLSELRTQQATGRYDDAAAAAATIGVVLVGAGVLCIAVMMGMERIRKKSIQAQHIRLNPFFPGTSRLSGKRFSTDESMTGSVVE